MGPTILLYLSNKNTWVLKGPEIVTAEWLKDSMDAFVKIQWAYKPQGDNISHFIGLRVQVSTYNL